MENSSSKMTRSREKQHKQKAYKTSPKHLPERKIIQLSPNFSQVNRIVKVSLNNIRDPSVFFLCAAIKKSQNKFKL